MQKGSFVLIISCLLFSCSSPGPEEYFSQASLNANLLYGFAGRGMQQQLASPSEKLVDEKTLATAPMKRAEVLQVKLDAVEAAYKKIKALKTNAEAKEMLNASRTLFEFVLPVYRKEYRELAAMYDNNAGADKISAMETSISEKYEPKFLELYNALGTAGKAYAAKHGIKVMEVNPSPR